VTSLTWSWEDLWAWWGQVDTPQKRFVWGELTKDEWMKNLPPKLQFEVMRGAPMEVLEQLKNFPDIFKYDTLLLLDSHVRKESGMPRRKYRR